MRKIIIRKDALNAVRDRAILPFQEQAEAGEIEIHGNKMKLFLVEIDTDVENFIRSRGTQVSDPGGSGLAVPGVPIDSKKLAGKRFNGIPTTTWVIPGLVSKGGG